MALAVVVAVGLSAADGDAGDGADPASRCIIGPPADGAVPTPVSSPQSRPAPSATPDASPAAWREIAPPPFAGPYVVAVAIGGQAIILQRDTGRAAVHDPATAEWYRLPRAPRRGLREVLASPAVWTGRELVVPVVARGEAGSTLLGGLAYDPGARSDDGVWLVELDPGGTGWLPPVTIADDGRKADAGGFPAGGRLLFPTWEADGLAEPLSVVYDPAERTVVPFRLGCDGGDGQGAVVAGERLVDAGATMTIDLETGECSALPPNPSGLFGGSLLWTGSELMVISGGPGDLAPFEARAFAISLENPAP